jgi:DNA-binding NtrC family response regulator
MYDYVHHFETNMSEKVLIVDDDPDVLQASRLALLSLGCQILTAHNPEQLPMLVNRQAVGVVLLDLNFERGSIDGEVGLGLLKTIKANNPDTAVIVVTAHVGISLAVEAMKLGASDFITKPWTNERLITTVRNALELRATKLKASRLEQQASEIANPSKQNSAMIGRSPAMQHVLSLIERAAPTDANVLILGENGTGKELVARALHQASKRADRSLITVDLGAVTHSLFESELFGHKKGSFTDAKSDRIGRLGAADRGTLFLDEIGNLPLNLQPKLLSALEQRQVTPVGSNAPMSIDVRVISATNLLRDELADEKKFRPDLLFRLNTLEIHIPPLRQRREDIPLLAAHFLAQYTYKYDKPLRDFTPAAIEALTEHDWPGNVRALRHAIERVVILSRGDRYTADDLALPKNHLTGARVDDQNTPQPDESANLNLERMEKELVERALKKNAWNISLAAKDLGLTRASLYRRMERYGL